jgi:hypothetical protein
VVVHTCNPSTQENHDFKASLGYIARFYLKKNKNKNKHFSKHIPNNGYFLVLSKTQQSNHTSLSFGHAR